MATFREGQMVAVVESGSALVVGARGRVVEAFPDGVVRVCILDTAIAHVPADKLVPLVTYKVQSLDVWGHAPSQCHEFGCQCCTTIQLDDDGDDVECTREHDDNECTCSFDINNWYDAGKIEVPKGCSDEELILALIESDHLNGVATTLGANPTVRVDDYGTGGDMTIEDTEHGLPLYQLTLIE